MQSQIDSVRERLRRSRSLDGRTFEMLLHEGNELPQIHTASIEHSFSAEHVCIAVDVEAYEHQQERILEIGLTQFCQPEGTLMCRHLIITENEHTYNGDYVEDNKEHFLFGSSERVTESRASEIVNEALLYADTIVGHALQGDIEWLQ